MARLLAARLDDEAAEALEQLKAAGRSESEAVCFALVETAAREDAGQLQKIARELAVDPDDRAEVVAVRNAMATLRSGEL